MKKIFLAITLIITVTLGAVGCGPQEEALTKVRLNEVVHSVFYAPQYVALEMGFFEEEGLDIELTVGQGADKSMTALISDEADIALLGTEAGVYVYNEGKENYAVPFAQLTQKAGNFLVSREPNEDFQWTDVKGKTIIGGRAGGMPQMILEYVCVSNGLTPGEDVEILTNLQYTTTAGAFAGGVGDYTVEFDPSALGLEKEGKGYTVASIGESCGEVPYTVYMCTKEYMEANPETIEKFTNGVYKGQQWVNEHTAAEIAEVIAPHFPENTPEDLTFMIDRYKQIGVWKTDPIIEKDDFDLLQDIMEPSGQLSKRIVFEEFINTEFAENAVNDN